MLGIELPDNEIAIWILTSPTTRKVTCSINLEKLGKEAWLAICAFHAGCKNVPLNTIDEWFSKPILRCEQLPVFLCQRKDYLGLCLIGDVVPMWRLIGLALVKNVGEFISRLKRRVLSINSGRQCTCLGPRAHL